MRMYMQEEWRLNNQRKALTDILKIQTMFFTKDSEAATESEFRWWFSDTSREL